MKFHDVAVYPDDYKGKKSTGSEAFRKYSLDLVKPMGKLGIYAVIGGDITSTIIGDNEPEWDSYRFAIYPSIGTFIKFVSLKIVQEAQIHRDAGAKKQNLYVTIPYEEYL